MSDITPTRAAVLELQDERRSMREGYEFLDEKRLLLAAEMLRELKRYESLWAGFQRALQEAATALREAVARHGFEGVQVYPPARFETLALEIAPAILLGVRLQQATLRAELGSAPPALNPSPEAERCRRVFLDVIEQSAALAAIAGNLERLRHEYRRTERRARALEDVLLPEIGSTIYDLESRLEEVEQEEAIRVRQG
jgi:V/A-type H+-transporting ATPase subunit D